MSSSTHHAHSAAASTVVPAVNSTVSPAIVPTVAPAASAATDAPSAAPALPQSFTIGDAAGLAVTVTDYGARLMAVTVPGRGGRATNVLLGRPTAADYLTDDCYLGAIIGRNANRIADATCVIDGAVCHPVANEGTNNVHSGPNGYDRRLWAVADRSERSLTLVLHSPDGDQGFPGAMDVRVRYEVDNMTLRCDIDAECTRSTIANMTSHAYWNLAGESSGDILDQILTIPTDRYCPTDERFIPLACEPVDGTPMDFRAPKRIGDAMRAGFEAGDAQLAAARGYNHAFVFEDAHGQLPHATSLNPRTGLRTVAVAASERTGIRMTVLSNAPSVLLYSAGFLDGVPGTGGRTYCPAAGYALEPGFVPNAVNNASERSPLLPAGSHYHLAIRWRFDAVG
ncbi:aldose epimerase family protein [Bifidobacterium biavatii]|uniref:Aldose 1-epimerase n=1 Tax=Bifidobacterium biavatii DSM 23969 TaxID=1437608 RepID=A0A087A1D8_9BIFI|nr:aldose epimerase family protein [Bifidobacterium biavatii]KFI52588.1 aldose 1-epimerase [Bifidobacterium biavatii DSM 23969]